MGYSTQHLMPSLQYSARSLRRWQLSPSGQQAAAPRHLAGLLMRRTSAGHKLHGLDLPCHVPRVNVGHATAAREAIQVTSIDGTQCTAPPGQRPEAAARER
eukprot:CAMPEP_0181214090 /NCGR_PEP_ID=MMETSP1096-20121128/25261_1 /TAXON_ID=156174 ORGANISM="Chrysochromulina ericina, Strain CCMP281" /NCGR_SAMPLE_ID=MMETSP1096 /ASSEMBLY_ACC=CAM_ASM_000453 /LENGTH=100 /DNA_ID=CAMNT_0023305789 /DNA_START=219 /DNA_END=518 /DNA_ORIENTATION=+